MAIDRPQGGARGRVVHQERAHATRRALLVAAGRHFAERGYHATTLHDLVDEGSVTKGALYFHYPSKEALARALVEAMSDSWDEVLAAVDREAADPLTGAVLLTDAVLVRLDDPVVRGAARVLRDRILEAPSLLEADAEWRRELSQRLHAADVAGLLLPRADPDWIAEEITTGFAGRATLAEAAGRPEELWDAMTAFWSGLLPLVADPGWLARWERRPWRDRGRPSGVGAGEAGAVRLSDLGADTPDRDV